MLGINFTTVIVAISFTVFIKLMEYLLWKPITQVQESRDTDILDAQNLATMKQEQAKQISDDIDLKIKAMRQEQSQEIEQISNQAKYDFQMQYEQAMLNLENNLNANIKVLDSDYLASKEEIPIYAKDLIKDMLDNILSHNNISLKSHQSL